VEPCIVNVALDTPLDITFDYRCSGENALPPPLVGQLVMVPFGHRQVAGMIVGIKSVSEVAADKLKDVISIRRQLSPLSQEWLALCRFAADYYQRPLGEVALPGLPKNLRAESPAAARPKCIYRRLPIFCSAQRPPMRRHRY
jgi:primosomal protein N' (replication factor Y)